MQWMQMSWESIYLLYSVSGQNELLLDWKSTVEKMDTMCQKHAI